MKQQGFSLIEIMIVIAIIAILSAIAIPSYQSYLQRAAMTDVLQSIHPYKTHIELCSFKTGSFSLCNTGVHNIPANIKGKYIESIDVKTGIIEIKTSKMLNGLSITLTPTLPTNNHLLTWTTTCTTESNSTLSTLCQEIFTF